MNHKLMSQVKLNAILKFLMRDISFRLKQPSYTHQLQKVRSERTDFRLILLLFGTLIYKTHNEKRGSRLGAIQIIRDIFILGGWVSSMCHTNFFAS